MGYFAVIANGPSTPTVDRCHINIWRYDSWLLPRTICFDVGLGLVTPADTVGATKFKLALPFSCDSYADLWESMKNPQVAQLVFGRAVDFGSVNTEVSYTDKQQLVSLKLISPKSVSRDESKSGRYYSMWDIELAKSPGPSEIHYLRLRFHVASFARSWFSHREGELIDIRVADTRESVAISEWNCFAREIIPTPNLRIFIVAPADLEPRTSSPSYKARALERSVWQPYTGGRDWTPSQRFAIYGFKPDDTNQPPSSHSPFRLYFALGRRRSRAWVDTLVVLTAAALGILIGRNICAADPWTELLQWVERAWDSHRKVIMGSVSLATLLKTRDWWERAKGVAPYLRKVDRFILFKAHR